MLLLRLTDHACSAVGDRHARVAACAALSVFAAAPRLPLSSPFSCIEQESLTHISD
jgi:hypothetical protein